MAVATRPRAVYVIPGAHPGLLRKGNIDLTKRPVVRLKNGSIATVRSISFSAGVEINGRSRNAEILIPTVVGNRVVSNRAAIQHFYSSHAHLGMFDTPAHATAYAVRLHNWQADYYRRYIRGR